MNYIHIYVPKSNKLNNNSKNTLSMLHTIAQQLRCEVVKYSYPCSSQL